MDEEISKNVLKMIAECPEDYHVRRVNGAWKYVKFPERVGQNTFKYSDDTLMELQPSGSLVRM